MTSVQNAPLSWDYTGLAAHYDRRADYSDAAIDEVLALANPDRSRPLADIGAGTGKLTKLLLARGFAVHAVEPNEAMRQIGIANTAGCDVRWTSGSGEHSGLADQAYDLALFGSSFNVTDRPRALLEVERILRSRCWFACLWNHRDLGDPVQGRIEAIIRESIPGYDYGSRREDQTAVIEASGLFEPPVLIERSFLHTTPVDDYMDAWRSHATLRRQAGDAFDRIVGRIAESVAGSPVVAVPYTTRVWCAKRRR